MGRDAARGATLRTLASTTSLLVWAAGVCAGSATAFSWASGASGIGVGLAWRVTLRVRRMATGAGLAAISGAGATGKLSTASAEGKAGAACS